MSVKLFFVDKLYLVLRKLSGLYFISPKKLEVFAQVDNLFPDRHFYLILNC